MAGSAKGKGDNSSKTATSSSKTGISSNVSASSIPIQNQKQNQSLRRRLLRAWFVLFFGYIEPVSALLGAYFAHMQQADYLAMTDPSGAVVQGGGGSRGGKADASYSYYHGHSIGTSGDSARGTITTSNVTTAESVVLSQLANLYLLFALNETLVLRCCNGNVRAWSALLLGMLVADAGHLYSLRPLGASIYWDVRNRWAGNPMQWGNVPFVYVGALSRLAYLLEPQAITLV